MLTYLCVGRVAPMVVVVAAVSASGCRATTVAPKRAATKHLSVAHAPSQPRTVHTFRIRSGRFRTIRPGTSIDPERLTNRVFADAKHGFALFGSVGGETFPAATIDGGRTWRIAGPVLHAPAAQGPLAVSQTGIAGPRTFMAFGDGSVVDVTTDGGKHWWRAGLGDEVPAVVASGGQLIAFAQESVQSSRQTLRAVVWVYRSTDGGRVWREDDLLAPP